MGSFAIWNLLIMASSFFFTCNANDGFLNCMAQHKALIYAPQTKNYTERYFGSVQNWRLFNHSTTPKPAFIFTPYTETQIKSAIICCKMNNLQIRVKSNGHDYESLSLLAHGEYIVIDLVNHAQIDIDIEKEEAYVETGTTIGELYLRISEKSQVHGFPAGACPSVGVGGHISGGGWGSLVRKYGLAADNVIDARLIDANGRILTRKTMGEDLFWAIRGSGGASFGIITAWKLRLVRVPSVVTLGKVVSLNETAYDLFDKWQRVAPNMPKDLFIQVFIKPDNEIINTFRAVFKITYLGPMLELLHLMLKEFPEMGLTKQNCTEYSWIQSVVKTAEFGDQMSSKDVLMAKQIAASGSKGKSDYVQTPIPKKVVIDIFEKFLNQERKKGEYRVLCMYTQGGKMDEIPSDAIPYPYRKGYLYGIEYLTKWLIDNNSKTVIERHHKWINDLYSFMEPYVSKNPRGSYINYKDLDLGENNRIGNTSYAKAKIWGEKYFQGNFERLAIVKSLADPENFFRNEQSIPLFM